MFVRDEASKSRAIELEVAELKTLRFFLGDTRILDVTKSDKADRGGLNIFRGASAAILVEGC